MPFLTKYCLSKHVCFAMTAILTMATLAAPVSAGIQLQPIGTYATSLFAAGAAEIVAHDPMTQRVFVVNAASQVVDAIDISDPTTPTLIGSFDVTPFGTQANSVAVHNGLVVAAVEADPKQAPGRAVFFAADTLAPIKDVEVGALPDMVTYTPNGHTLLVVSYEVSGTTTIFQIND